MATLLSKLIVSCALALSIVCSIPATTTYTRAPESEGEVITAVITSYNSVPEQTDDTPFDTASGTHVHDGTLACPYAYAFGTQVLIAGKIYTCEDTMAKKYRDGNFFDIWMSDAEAAKNWGRKTMEITILQ